MSKLVHPLSLASLLSVTLLIAGCSAQDAGPEVADRPARVVTTIGMIADIARQVAGDEAVTEVEALMGPGIDPHLYKASEGDVRKLSEADLILYNGLYLEGKMGDILVKLARARPVVAVSEGVDPDKLREPPEFQGHYDPHLWFDVALWAQTIDPIAEALIELRPGAADDIRANAEQTRARLLDLDAWVASRIDEIPAERRVLITAHDAFGYFGQRYGIEVIGIQGISTLAEAGLQDVDRVVDLIVERDIPALFVESSVPRRTVEAVQVAVASRGASVTIGGELFSDAMGAAGTDEGTYEGMVRHNVDTIVNALTADGRVKESADDPRASHDA